jgi:hypothetical protein
VSWIQRRNVMKIEIRNGEKAAFEEKSLGELQVYPVQRIP